MLQLGVETTKLINGKSYTFGRVTHDLIAQFHAWVVEREGDPFELCLRFKDQMTPEVWADEFKRARETRDQLKAFTLESPVAQKWLRTPEGAAHLFWLLLKDRQPDITESEAFQVFLSLGFAEAKALLEKGAGRVPKNA